MGVRRYLVGSMPVPVAPWRHPSTTYLSHTGNVSLRIFHLCPRLSRVCFSRRFFFSFDSCEWVRGQIALRSCESGLVDRAGCPGLPPGTARPLMRTPVVDLAIRTRARGARRVTSLPRGRHRDARKLSAPRRSGAETTRFPVFFPRIGGAGARVRERKKSETPAVPVCFPEQRFAV